MNARIVLILPIMLAAGACAPKRPVLYPNEQYRRAGERAAQRDVDDCIRRAEQYTSSSNGREVREVAGKTAVGAGTGAAVGAVVGAIDGDPGRNAARGAAAGGTAGFVHGMFGVFGKNDPPDIQKAFVERCLRERGYDTLGWE
jgi:hypothetical protein